MKILVIVAHLDDEILGCGGTILKHIARGDTVTVCIVTKGYEPNWSAENLFVELKQAREVDNIMGITERIYCDFPVVKLNTIPNGELNNKISRVIHSVNPDVIYTHYKNDVNMDHVIVYNSVMVATRPTGKKIAVRCCEVLSASEWSNNSFNPNYYVNIDGYIDKKIEAFLKYSYEVKEYPHPRSKDGIKILASKRGNDICIEYAEAFMIVRSYW